MSLRRLVASDLSHRCNPLRTTGFGLLALYIRSKKELAISVGAERAEEAFSSFRAGSIMRRLPREWRSPYVLPWSSSLLLMPRPVPHRSLLLGGGPSRLSGWQDEVVHDLKRRSRPWKSLFASVWMRQREIQLLGVDGGAAGLATHLEMWPGSGVLQSSEVAAGQTS